MRVLSIIFCLLFSSFSHTTCLQNGKTVTLTGIIVSKTYQSPDDVPESAARWILQLDKPFDCVVDIDKSFQEWNKDVTVFPPDTGEYKDISFLINKHVIVSGTLALASTAYNYTAVLLLADKIETIPER